MSSWTYPQSAKTRNPHQPSTTNQLPKGPSSSPRRSRPKLWRLQSSHTWERGGSVKVLAFHHSILCFVLVSNRLACLWETQKPNQTSFWKSSMTRESLEALHFCLAHSHPWHTSCHSKLLHQQKLQPFRIFQILHGEISLIHGLSRYGESHRAPRRLRAFYGQDRCCPKN